MLCVAKKGEARLLSCGILSVSEVHHLQTRHQQVNFQERGGSFLTLEALSLPNPGTLSLSLSRAKEVASAPRSHSDIKVQCVSVPQMDRRAFGVHK